jgi:hypothetical protein
MDRKLASGKYSWQVSARVEGGVINSPPARFSVSFGTPPILPLLAVLAAIIGLLWWLNNRRKAKDTRGK